MNEIPRDHAFAACIAVGSPFGAGRGCERLSLEENQDAAAVCGRRRRRRARPPARRPDGQASRANHLRRKPHRRRRHHRRATGRNLSGRRLHDHDRRHDHACAGARRVSQPADDPIKDFTTIGRIGTSAILLVATPNFAANDLHALAEMSKGEPVQYGTWGVGSTGHFCGEILSQKGGVRLQHVPFSVPSSPTT